MGRLILWSKTFYTTIGQYPTLYNFLAITREDLIRWEYHLDNPNTSENPKKFYINTFTSVLWGDVTSHAWFSSLQTRPTLNNTLNKN